MNLAICYGRPSLIHQVTQQATVSILPAAIGNCYLYWGANGNLELVRHAICDSHVGEPDAVNAIEKVLIHAGPPKAALLEMARVTRRGGHVGAIEWLPFFHVSSRDSAALDAFNAVFRKACFDYFVSGNLARQFHAAGLRNLKTEAILAHTYSLDSHPFWRAFIVSQMPMFVHVGLIEEAVAQTFLADIEELTKRNEFSASFIVQAAVGEH